MRSQIVEGRVSVKVFIKDFGIDMDVKTRGIELEVRDTQDKHLGDLIVTKTAVIWCKGRTRRENGKKVTWE